MSSDFEFKTPIPTDKFISMLVDNGCDIDYKQNPSFKCGHLKVSKDGKNFVYAFLDNVDTKVTQCKQVEFLSRYGQNDPAWLRKLIKDYFDIDIGDL